MPRKGGIVRRESVPDPKFDSVLVTRFINAIMSDGKRSTAERHFYKAMTTYADHPIWQDVYRTPTPAGKWAYVKITLRAAVPVIQFKEL